MTQPTPATTAVRSTLDPKTDRSLALALAAAEAADDRKGVDITLLYVGEVAYLADYFLIVSGYSPVQLKAIARSIEERLSEDFGIRLSRKEGTSESRWLLQDYGDLVVHIFIPEERELYNLEAFWSHGETVPWQELITPSAS